ncbi:hypothetical protein GCM10008927_28390 [Amylibacter ulvae]|uniref:Uncharacterized protein n=1 Tax=Paramylibacter ulvae TaxID=1651968 RepID=A0ABQ3D7W1_9RHOB|nr:hypothetical protein GCM10008927_28390 [Amylibacter ulvae]
MNHDWMLDVLEDLKSFANTHELERLAEHLDSTLNVAESDLATFGGATRVQKRNGSRLVGVHPSRRTC